MLLIQLQQQNAIRQIGGRSVKIVPSSNEDRSFPQGVLCRVVLFLRILVFSFVLSLERYSPFRVDVEKGPWPEEVALHTVPTPNPWLRSHVKSMLL